MKSVVRFVAGAFACAPLLGFTPYEWKGLSELDSVRDGVLYVRPTSLEGAVTGEAVPLVWYDARHQAIAVDAYADGYGNSPFRIDFNADHTWSIYFDQRWVSSAYYDVYRPSFSPSCQTPLRTSCADDTGVRPASIGWDEHTEIGLAYLSSTCGEVDLCKPQMSSDWCVFTNGWFPDERLDSGAPLSGFLSDVVPAPSLEYFPVIGSSLATADRFEVFTDAWDVAHGATVIYLRPLDRVNGPIPVTAADAANVWVSLGAVMQRRWYSLGGAVDPPPCPGPDRWYTCPLAATLKIAPRTLSQKGAGQWISVQLNLLPGQSAESVDPASLRLSVETTVPGRAGDPDQVVRYASGPLKVLHDGDLVVKLNRDELRGNLSPGEAKVALSGAFRDGSLFHAHGTINVIP